MYALIAKAIRISHAKFHCNRLTTVHLFKIMRVSFFFGTHCTTATYNHSSSHWIQNSRVTQT